MAISSLAVANAFLDLAEEQCKTLTNMQVQKLVFLAQGYCMALLDRPIHYHNTHAWQFGPVIPRLYKNLQKYGNGVVSEHVTTDESIDKNSEDYQIVRGVFKVYGGYTGGQLSSLTHEAGTPWSQTWGQNRFGIIDDELMGAFYKKKLGRTHAHAEQPT